MTPDCDDQPFSNVGSFPAQEAQHILKSLEAANIPFAIETSDEGIRNQDVLLAQTGGTFGEGARIRIYISEGDVETFHQIYRRITFGEVPEMPADEIKEYPEATEEELLITQPSSFALFGYWFIGILAMLISIGVGLQLKKSGHLWFFIPTFGAFGLFMVFFLYRMTQKHFRARRKAEQAEAAQPPPADSSKW